MANSSLVKAVDKWRRSPYEWIKTFYPKVFVWSKMKELLRAIEDGEKRICIRAAHAVSKTFTASLLALWHTSINSPVLTVTTAPTYRQINSVLWKEIRQNYSRSKYRLSKVPPLLKSPDWYISGFQRALGVSAWKPEKLQGLHEEKVMNIIDEACGISAEMFPALYSIVTGENDLLIAIGNPDTRNPDFMRMFSDPSFYKIRISAFDSPNFTGEFVPDALRRQLISKSWVKELIASNGEDSMIVKSKVYAEFPETDSSSIIPESVFLEAEERTESDIVKSDKKLAGVDVARYGNDKTVIYTIDKNIAKCFAERSGISTMEIAGMCVQLIIAGYDVAIDDTGVGGGVTDRVREMGYRIFPVNFGQSAAEKTRFMNARSEMYWEAKEWLLKTGKVENDEELKKELTTIRYSIHSSGRMVIEGKELIKKRLHKSPDKADAFVIAIAGHKYDSKQCGILSDNDCETEVCESAGAMF